MQITNVLNLPHAIVEACTTERHNKKGCLSATTLLHGTKEILLTERHWEEITDDVSNRIWAIFGTAVHSILERETENTFVEVPVSCEINGITVTGRIDNFDMKTGTIEDYKTASIWKVQFKDFDDWEKQGMIYAFLMRELGFTVNKIRFVAMLKDHSKSKARNDKSYPQSPVYVYQFIPTKKMFQEIKEFIYAGIINYKQFELLSDDEIPACTEKERWAKPTQYAAMKEGRKSAVKLFDNKHEADIFVFDNGGFVEERKGVSTKCVDYCICKEFCNFYKSIKVGE